MHDYFLTPRQPGSFGLLQSCWYFGCCRNGRLLIVLEHFGSCWQRRPGEAIFGRPSQENTVLILVCCATDEARQEPSRCGHYSKRVLCQASRAASKRRSKRSSLPRFLILFPPTFSSKGRNVAVLCVEVRSSGRMFSEGDVMWARYRFRPNDTRTA